MFSFRAIPLITVSVVIYNLMILLGGKDVFGAEAFHFPMVNGGRITFSWGDLLLAVTLILLFFEIIKSTYVSSVGQLEHILSVIVGVFCIVELLVSEKGQTSVFFLLHSLTSREYVQMLGYEQQARFASFGSAGVSRSVPASHRLNECFLDRWIGR